jgi:hypothetical protein
VVEQQFHDTSSGISPGLKSESILSAVVLRCDKPSFGLLVPGLALTRRRHLKITMNERFLRSFTTLYTGISSFHDYVDATAIGRATTRSQNSATRCCSDRDVEHRGPLRFARCNIDLPVPSHGRSTIRHRVARPSNQSAEHYRPQKQQTVFFHFPLDLNRDSVSQVVTYDRKLPGYNRLQGNSALPIRASL